MVKTSRLAFAGWGRMWLELLRNHIPRELSLFDLFGLLGRPYLQRCLYLTLLTYTLPSEESLNEENIFPENICENYRQLNVCGYLRQWTTVEENSRLNENLKKKKMRSP